MEALYRMPRWLVILSLLLAAVFLWRALRGVSWEETVRTAWRGRWDLLLFGFLLQSLSYFIRGLRWHVLLRAETSVSIRVTFWTMMIGYLGNNFLPAKAGELIRSFMIGRHANISKSYALATIFTERIIDLVVLVLTCLTLLFFLKEMPGWLVESLPILGGVALGGVAALFFIPRHEQWLKARLPRFLLPEFLRDPASETLGKFFVGMHIFQQSGRALGFLGLTGIIWVIDAWVAIEAARAFSLTLPFVGALLLLGTLGLSGMIPSTPGSIGIFQFVGVTVLVLFDFTRSEAIVYIVALQAVIYAAVIVWGTAGIWCLSVKKGSLTNRRGEG